MFYGCTYTCYATKFLLCAFACICVTTVITKSQDCFYQKFLSISPDIHSSHQNLMIIALKTHDCIITTTTTQINPTKNNYPPPHTHTHTHTSWLSDQNLLTKNSLETHVYLYKQISWSSPPKPLSVLLNSHDCIIRKMYACLTKNLCLSHQKFMTITPKKTLPVSPGTYDCFTKNSWQCHQNIMTVSSWLPWWNIQYLLSKNLMTVSPNSLLTLKTHYCFFYQKSMTISPKTRYCLTKNMLQSRQEYMIVLLRIYDCQS